MARNLLLCARQFPPENLIRCTNRKFLKTKQRGAISLNHQTIKFKKMKIIKISNKKAKEDSSGNIILTYKGGAKGFSTKYQGTIISLGEKQGVFQGFRLHLDGYLAIAPINKIKFSFKLKDVEPFLLKDY